jgi:hypothetical protein
MTKQSYSAIAIGLLLNITLAGCQQAGKTDGDGKAGKINVDERQIQGFQTRTFYNEHNMIEATIATDGKSTIVAFPRAAIGRGNQIGDTELECLKKCKDIADLEARLNCILKCPVSKKYQVFIY